MKIEIEWTCSHKAKITIAGRVLEVSMYPGVTQLDGLKKREGDETLGGMIAHELFAKIGDIMQAECIAADELSPDGSQDVTWLRMKKKTAAEVYNRIS